MLTVEAGINKQDAAPDAVFMFIKISYKIFYNRFKLLCIVLLGVEPLQPVFG